MLLSDSKASSQFILNAVNGEDIILKSEGNQYFSYIYVGDAVSAILHCYFMEKVAKRIISQMKILICILKIL